MDFCKTFEKSCVLALSNTRSNNYLMFFLKPDNTIDSKWIMRNKSNEFLNTKEVSMLEKAAIPLSVKENAQGLLEVSFGGLTVSKDRTLYLAKLDSSDYAIVFQDEESKQMAQMKEVFVDLTNEPIMCYCRCKYLHNNLEFTESVQVDIGPLKYFLS